MQIPDVRLMCVVMMKHGVSGFPCPAVGTPAAGRPGAPWATGVAMEVPKGPAITPRRSFFCNTQKSSNIEEFFLDVSCFMRCISSPIVLHTAFYALVPTYSLIFAHSRPARTSYGHHLLNQSYIHTKHRSIA